jgi:hypothetical protein
MAELISRLHAYYNWALVVVERNLAQYGFFDLLYAEGVYNLYSHADGKHGYPVNTATKPIIVENFAELMRVPGAASIRCADLVSEMHTFQYQAHRGARYMSAVPGAHDDELMAAMLAFMPEARQRAMIPYNRSSGSLSAASKPRLIPFEV